MAAADKGLHHRRDPLPGRVVQVQQVPAPSGRAAQLHPGQGDAFPAFQHPAPGDGAGDYPAAGLHPQSHESVIQQNLLPRATAARISGSTGSPQPGSRSPPPSGSRDSGKEIIRSSPPHIDDQLRRTAGSRPSLLHRIGPGAAGSQCGMGQVQPEAGEAQTSRSVSSSARQQAGQGWRRFSRRLLLVKVVVYRPGGRPWAAPPPAVEAPPAQPTGRF